MSALATNSKLCEKAEKQKRSRPHKVILRIFSKYPTALFSFISQIGKLIPKLIRMSALATNPKLCEEAEKQKRSRPHEVILRIFSIYPTALFSFISQTGKLIPKLTISYRQQPEDISRSPKAKYTR